MSDYKCSAISVANLELNLQPIKMPNNRTLLPIILIRSWIQISSGHRTHCFMFSWFYLGPPDKSRLMLLIRHWPLFLNALCSFTCPRFKAWLLPSDNSSLRPSFLRFCSQSLGLVLARRKEIEDFPPRCFPFPRSCRHLAVIKITLDIVGGLSK